MTKIFLIMLNDSKSVIISISKKRTYLDKSPVISLKRKQYQIRKKIGKKVSDVELKRYTLPDEESLPISKLKQAEILLPFKQYSKRQDRHRFSRRLAISIYEKYKIISTELQKRLQVDDPVNNIYSVIDIDEDYFRYLDGRPLSIRNSGFKTLKVCIIKLLQLRLEIGIKEDCIFNIETTYRNELDIYDLSVKRLTDQAKYFDAFISGDYKKSMDILAKWDKLKFQIDLKINELQNVGIEKFTIKSRLIGLEYKYALQQKYGRFLYYLSPPIWRLNNREFARSVEIEAKGFDFGHSQEEDTFATIFEKLREVCYRNPIKPALYFTQPKDLIDVFVAMENQQLHYYTHVNHLTPHANILKERIKSLKDVIFQDYAVVANSIKLYENLLKFSEDRCTQMEEMFFKILFGLFYDSVGALDVLKLTLHLEFCYEKVFLEKPTNMDMIVVAKSIEKLYMDYSKKLDAIKGIAVRRAMLKCIDLERLNVKKANYAAKELRLFHRLERELLKAHGIFVDNNIYTPLKRNPNVKRNKTYSSPNKLKKEQSKRKTLTEAELEYLSLFTEWTENDDPANYLQSLNSKHEDEK